MASVPYPKQREFLTGPAQSDFLLIRNRCVLTTTPDLSELATIAMCFFFMLFYQLEYFCTNGRTIEANTKMVFKVFQNTNESHNPDFTPIFQDVVFFIVPLCLAMVFGALRLRQLSTASVVARFDSLCIFKVVCNEDHLR